LTVAGAVNDILTGVYRGGGVGGGAPLASPYIGPIVVKYVNYDVGQLYAVPDGLYGRALVPGAPDAVASGPAPFMMDSLPTVTPASFALAPGEDGWGIAAATEIWDATQTIRLWSAAVSPFEFTGMFWGIVDTYLDQSSGGTDQEIHAVGYKAAFYVDDTPDFDPVQGGLGPSARTGIASYPDATDGLLFWSMNGLAGAADTNFPLDEFLTNFNPSAAPGAPSVGEGKVAGTYGPNAAGVGGANSVFDLPTGADWSVRFTGISPTGSVSPWLVQSNDPLVTTAIPDPAAIYAGLLGLGFLVGRRAWRGARV
jgi:hypothetical protein